MAVTLWWDDELVAADAAAFAAAYARRSGFAVEELAAWGRFPEPCRCEGPDCGGWAMGHQWEEAVVEDLERRLAIGPLVDLDDHVDPPARCWRCQIDLAIYGATIIDRLIGRHLRVPPLPRGTPAEAELRAALGLEP